MTLLNLSLAKYIEQRVHTGLPTQIKKKEKVRAMATICNICGKVLTKCEEKNHVKINQVMGYGSQFDGDRVDMDICNKCFDKLIERCKIDPIQEERM